MPKQSPDLSSIPLTINGYHVLPLHLPATPSAPSATHYLYLQRRESKTPNPLDERSLFAVNVPIDATEEHFRVLFSRGVVGGGMVETVRFGGEPVVTESVSIAPAVGSGKKEKDRGSGKKRKRGAEGDGAGAESVDMSLPKVWDRKIHRSGGTAVVVFVDKSSLEITLKTITKLRKKIAKNSAGSSGTVENGVASGPGGLPIWGEGIAKEKKLPPLGIQRYLTHHTLTFPTPTLLQSSTDAYMAHFTRLEQLRARNLARMRNQVDEDGFTLVVRGGRTAPAKQDEAQELAERKRQEEEEKRKQNVGFYRFQQRDAKKERAKLLLQKFEADKRRVEERKKMRKFKPL